MNALRLKLWVSLVFMLFIVAVPGVIANHAVKVIRAQQARSEASSQSLSAFQRLAVLGYTLQQERYTDPSAFVQDRELYIDGVRSHVTNAERYINAATAVTGPSGPQSICSASFEKIIGDFGTTLQTSFFLTRTPVQNTTQCTVTKDAVTTTVPATNFSVDLARGAVDFSAANAPPAGAVVKCCYSVR